MLIFEYFEKEVKDLIYEPSYKTKIKKVTIKKKVNRKLITFNITGYGKNITLFFSAPLVYPSTISSKEHQVLCFADKIQMNKLGLAKQRMFEYLCELSKEVKQNGRERKRKDNVQLASFR
jgi:hypothetical protein